MRQTFTTRISPWSGFCALLLVSAALLLGSATACSDDDDGGGVDVIEPTGQPDPEPDPDPDPGAPAEEGLVSTPPPDATQVNVQLAEWSITPDVDTVAAGEVYFLADNAGAEPHELVVIRSDLAPERLPTGDDGGVPEDEVDMIGEIEPFAAGSQASVAFNLEPGSYLLICNVVEEEESGELESHYQEGMRTAFTVD